MSLATYLVIAASSWYLLNSMAGILRPLLLALLVGYIILPVYHRLKRHLPGLLARIAMLLVIFGFFWIIYKIANSSIYEFQAEIPAINDKLKEKIASLQGFAEEEAPWLKKMIGEVEKIGAEASNRIPQLVGTVASWVGSFLVEFFVVFLYLASCSSRRAGSPTACGGRSPPRTPSGSR